MAERSEADAIDFLIWILTETEAKINPWSSQFFGQMCLKPANKNARKTVVQPVPLALEIVVQFDQLVVQKPRSVPKKKPWTAL